ncbi:hypothetical protein ABT391_35870 [Streptomyces jumonjinensis]|uniref:BACON domain-containing protein n=2 Tax=Streptomyces jumonjinensis TaxID=1945 RepID=UPI003322CFB0
MLRDHDAATAVLGDVLVIAERQHGRRPGSDSELRAWLYALARWACLGPPAQRRRAGRGAHTGRPAVSEERPRLPEETAGHRRAELARLAWPEAAGTSPEQRDALELAVRHGLGPAEVAAVIGVAQPAARELLAAAACEVERTRAALAVAAGGNCPLVARLAGEGRAPLSAAPRNELVRHVDDCPRCRRAAEHAGAGGPWPGSAVTPHTLPLLRAPRAAVFLAMRHSRRVTGPRFGPAGFPLDPKDHAARRDRLRARAVTTTVVATVVAAPVLALWAAYRGAPLTGEGRHGGASVSAPETEERKGPYDRFEHTGRSGTDRGTRFTAGARVPGAPAGAVATGPPSARPGKPGPGRLTVEAEPFGDTTAITLRASGGSPVQWSMWTDAAWLSLSRTSGVLRPGEVTVVRVMVDTAREPEGKWAGRVGVDPSGAVVAIEGQGPAAVTARPSSPSPSASAPLPASSPPETSAPVSPTPTETSPVFPTPLSPSP